MCVCVCVCVGRSVGPRIAYSLHPRLSFPCFHVCLLTSLWPMFPDVYTTYLYPPCQLCANKRCGAAVYVAAAGVKLQYQQVRYKHKLRVVTPKL